MTRQCREILSKARSREAGFTLIDISIGLIIVGILIVPLMWQYNVEQRQELHSANVGGVHTARNALSRFLQENGRYPCPANPLLTTSDAGHGEEVCTGLPTAGNCSDAGGTGICVFTGNRNVDPTAGNDLIVQGALPYKTLGIVPSRTVDPYFRKFGYVVSFNVMSGVPVVNPTELDPVTGLPFRNYTYEELGVITVENYDLETDTIDLNPLLPYVTKTDVEAVIIGYGDNGAGAYRVSDGGFTACTAGQIDTENCDRDHRFVSRQYKLVPGANYNDDYIQFEFAVGSADWGVDKSTRNYFMSKDTAFVGIGTTSPTQKMEVVGNVRVDKVRNINVCDENGADCFDTNVVAGAGIQCPPGFLMKGTMLSSGAVAADCTKPVFPVTSAISCPANQYVYAITHDGSGGVQLQCSGP